MTKKHTPTEFLRTGAPAIEDSSLADRVARSTERRKGEWPGNAEQKLGALILRLEEALSKDAPTRERLIERFTANLLVGYDDIPEAYWKRQEQLARDNGHSIQLNESQKQYLAEQLQDAQRTGIESWTNYLTQAENQYPSWFKLYAFEGMTKMGIFDKEAGSYKKRSKGTVAPYPQLSPAALAKTYDFVQQYKIEGKEVDDEASVPESNNFNKVYSHFLVETGATVATPEKAEDARGDWREYTDVDELVEAAQGTPWCIAGDSMAELYLSGPGAFHLFHLKNPETDQVSPTAAASIRLEKGVVAEISGLKDGSNQYVEDALVPIVMEKVRSLPGGEKYLEAFEDKQKLIAMDRKFLAEPREPFTLEELEFLYEVNDEIKILDTYQQDPRIDEFRQERVLHASQLAEKYGEGVAGILTLQHKAEDYFEELMQGEFRELIFSRCPDDFIAENLDRVLSVGVDVDTIVDRLMEGGHFWVVVANLEQLLAAGADAQNILNQLAAEDPWAIAASLDQLLAAGAVIDVDALVDQLAAEDPRAVVANLDRLRAAGAIIDVDALVNRLAAEDPLTVAYNLDRLLAAGAVIDRNVYR